ncbi:MAG: META domain-containing protein [Stigonema ocellatum SAG 48.90 = DSM 106950]|nr:META domain-containing protein [Stigonema ocellatum SAG 48.90 = DSM 106950]
MNPKRSFLTTLTHGIFAVLVAVSVSHHSRAIAQTSSTNLAGTSWKLISLGNPEELSEPIDGTTITAQFNENQVRGSGSCNNYIASYETNDDLLTVGSAAATKKSCAPEILAQESRYFVDLAAVKSYQINDQGQLEIFYETADENGVLLFANADMSTVNLTGTSWTLVKLGSPDNLSEPVTDVGGSNITAHFTEDRVTGSGGCNFYTAAYQTSGDVFQVNPNSFASTLKFCFREEISDQESRYFGALIGAQNYRINDQGQLEISYDTGSENGLLIFDKSQ